MADCNIPEQDSPHPTHQDFRWIDGASSDTPLAGFIGLTRDIAGGIHTCLEIMYASALQREINRDAEPGDAAAPAIGLVEADQLMRLTMASSLLLQQEAARRIDLENEGEAGAEMPLG